MHFFSPELSFSVANMFSGTLTCVTFECKFVPGVRGFSPVNIYEIYFSLYSSDPPLFGPYNSWYC
jgi:hypothetical protein